MPLINERSAVIQLYKAGHQTCEILRELGWSRRREPFVRYTIQRFQDRPRTARTPRLIRNVAQRIRRNPQRLQRVMARSYGVSTSTIIRTLSCKGKATQLLPKASRTFHSFGIESGHINPYSPPLEVIDLIQKAAMKLGVTEGPFKVDLMKDRKYGWIIMECATRLSGGFDHMKTCPMATGNNITDAMLDYAIHGKGR